MNRNVTTVSRQIYNTFMLLGDLGGIYGLLISIASVTLYFINYNSAENMLIADLFSVKKEQDEQAKHIDP